MRRINTICNNINDNKSIKYNRKWVTFKQAQNTKMTWN